METVLSPSILSADFTELGAEIEILKEAGVRCLHLDVMDGMFVPNISFGIPVIKSVRKRTDQFLDAHLMIEDPERYIDAFADAGADGITVHAEACVHLDRTISHIRKRGLKAAVALNPATPLSFLEEILPELDMALVMTVNPGYGGQSYIPYCTDKIRRLRAMADRVNPSLSIQVDGGVNRDTIAEAVAAGADNLVAGSAVFRGDIRQNVELLTDLMKKASGEDRAE